MNQITLTFDRIFDLHRYPGGRYQNQHTLFSFSSNIGSQYGVAVPGWPAIEQGMTVTAVLNEADNWQTLVGWINHESKEITASDPTRTLWGAIFSAISAIFFYFPAFGAGSGASKNMKIISACFMAAFMSGAVSSLFQWRKQKKLIQRLKQVVR